MRRKKFLGGACGKVPGGEISSDRLAKEKTWGFRKSTKDLGKDKFIVHHNSAMHHIAITTTWTVNKTKHRPTVKPCKHRGFTNPPSLQRTRSFTQQDSLWPI